MHDAALTAAVVLASASTMIGSLAVFEATIAKFQFGQRKEKRKRGGQSSHGPRHTAACHSVVGNTLSRIQNRPSSDLEIEAELEDCPSSTVTRMA